MNATKIFILVGLPLAVYLHSAEGESRQKRSLWNLYQLLKKVANVDALKGLNGHGNYCGWGGSGTPVDGMDRCCQQHDNCYRRKPWYCLNFKWLGFNYRCSGSICYCLDPSWSCRGRACSCDLVFAKCVRRYRYLLRG